MPLAEIVYDGELSTSAHFVLAGMFLVIIGGLSWCFYKALAPSNKEPDEQLPDEI